MPVKPISRTPLPRQTKTIKLGTFWRQIGEVDEKHAAAYESDPQLNPLPTFVNLNFTFFLISRPTKVLSQSKSKEIFHFSLILLVVSP